MRKVLSATLILILFVNLFGYFISFTVQRYKIRAEVREFLKQEKKKHAREFVFTEEEFSKLDKREGGREFCLNGDMYDVISKTKSHEKIILTAYYDHKETGLLGKFLSVFKDESSSTKGKSQRFFSFSLLEFVTTDASIKIYTPVKILALPDYSSKLFCNFIAPLSPPPDLA